MALNRFGEFFHSDTGAMSMTRLLCFLSFFPASYVIMASKSAEALAWYLAAYTGAYVGGKFADVKGVKNANSSVSD
jgi:hypothetical protein